MSTELARLAIFVREAPSSPREFPPLERRRVRRSFDGGHPELAWPVLYGANIVRREACRDKKSRPSANEGSDTIVKEQLKRRHFPKVPKTPVNLTPRKPSDTVQTETFHRIRGENAPVNNGPPHRALAQPG